MTVERWGDYLATADIEANVGGSEHTGRWHGGANVGATVFSGDFNHGSTSQWTLDFAPGAETPFDGEGIVVGQGIACHDPAFVSTLVSEEAAGLLALDMTAVASAAVAAGPSVTPTPNPADDPSPPARGIATGWFQYEGHAPNVIPAGTVDRYGYMIVLSPWVTITSGNTAIQSDFDNVWAQIVSGVSVNIRDIGGTYAADLLTRDGTTGDVPSAPVTPSWLAGLSLIANESIVGLPGACPAFDTDGGSNFIRLHIEGAGLSQTIRTVLAPVGTLPDAVGVAVTTPLVEAATWVPANVDGTLNILGFVDIEPFIVGHASYSYPRVRYQYRFPGTPLRQYPRDDGPRQVKETSKQATTRQGWIGTYR